MRRRSLLAWAALPVTDRRWAAPLSAGALGFGLFVGVALSPSAAGTLAGGAAPLLVEVVDGGAGGSSSQAVADPGAEVPPESAVPSPVEGPVFASEGSGQTSFTEEGSAALPTIPTSPTPPPPEPAEEESDDLVLAGVVIHRNDAAGSYTLAADGGALSVVHAGKLPAAGTELEVPARALANGTYAEAGRRAGGDSTARATLLGTVSYVLDDPLEPGYVLSGRGVSVPIRVRPTADGSPPDIPQPGTLVSTLVAIEAPVEDLEPAPATASEDPPPACPADPELRPLTPQPSERLWQRNYEEKGEPGDYSELAGIVAGVCPELGVLSLTADDDGSFSDWIEVSVPPEIDLSDLTPGDSVTATASLTEGAYALMGIASDERIRGADDAGSAQGDLRR